MIRPGAVAILPELDIQHKVAAILDATICPHDGGKMEITSESR
jgi:hypothetical protein